VKLFFHHVGQKGADEDFKKTVYKDVSMQTVESNVPVNYLHRDELLNRALNLLRCQHIYFRLSFFRWCYEGSGVGPDIP
jgi:hypothetical protein